MQEVTNIHAAKTHLSKLISRVEQGEEIVIARGGQPVAKLVPYRSPKTRKRTLGAMKGMFEVPPDFDAPLPDEVLSDFER